MKKCPYTYLQRALCADASAVCLPVVAFLAKLFLEVTEGEAVGFHHAAIRNFLATEKVGDHQLLRPENTTRTHDYSMSQTVKCEQRAVNEDTEAGESKRRARSQVAVAQH